MKVVSKEVGDVEVQGREDKETFGQEKVHRHFQTLKIALTRGRFRVHEEERGSDLN